MKKVIYSVSRFKKGQLNKVTGLGYITDTDLVIACLSKNGKPYIRVFEDCIRKCAPVVNKLDEFKGEFNEYVEVDIDTGKSGYETREIEIEYNIWFKLAE
jgi:hypothetical protein